MTSGLRREVDENCALLSYYAEGNGNCLTDVSGQPVGLIFMGSRIQKFLTLVDGSDMLLDY